MKEREIHKQIIGYLRAALPPPAVVLTIPGGDGARTQAPGYVKGTPDILVVMPVYGAFFFEVKGPRGVVSDAQKTMADLITRADSHVFVVRSIEDVQKALIDLDVPLRGRVAA